MALQRIHASDLLDPDFKICCWDIETTSLNASFGHVLTVGIKPLHGVPILFRIDGFPGYDKARWDDKKLVYAAKKELEKYNVAIAYNGMRFDVPFMASRLLHHGIKPLATTIKHVDPVYIARHRMRIHSNSLENLLEHLQAHERKTPLTPYIWQRAAAGDKKSLDSIVRHNRADLLSLEEAFLKLLPLLDIKFGLIR